MEFPELDELNIEAEEGVTVEDGKATAVKMGFIGGGQGGCKIADEFYTSAYRRILLVNTTDQDMAGLNCPNKIIIGSGVAGAGKNPDVGRKAAEECREDILRACKKAFGSNVEWIMVTVGLGGGTGSGSCETLISVAKDYMISIDKEPRVGVIAAFPKKAEGLGVKTNAQKIMASLLDSIDSKTISPLIIMDNEKIGKMFPKATITNFYSIANKNIVGLFNVFNELAAMNSPYMTLDPADYKSLLSSGAIIFGMAPITNFEDDTVIASIIQKNVKSGLLSDSLSSKGASHAGAILVASKAMLETIPQSSFDMAFETLSRSIGTDNLVLHSGIYEGSESLGNKAMLYTIIAGLK